MAIYLIGGPAKVGKTKLAERLLQEKKIPYLPTDIFIEVLKANKLGEFSAGERATKFFPYFSAMMKIVPNFRSDFCIEGNSFMPEQVKILERSLEAQLKVCFLGMSVANLETILKHTRFDSWLWTDLTEKERQEYPGWLMKNSEEVEEQCRLHGYQYFDLADNYDAVLEQAYKHLSN